MNVAGRSASVAVAMVMVNGRLYDATTLNEVASGNRQRGRLFGKLADSRRSVDSGEVKPIALAGNR